MRFPFRRLARWLAVVVVVVVVVGAAGFGANAVATENDRTAYPRPGRVIAIAGYDLHLNCQGSGQPIVLLEAPEEGTSLDWTLIQPEIAKRTTVCSYDRAGLGWSAPGRLPRTAPQMAAEVRALLHQAGMPPPYVLVGASNGGLAMQFFASVYADDVTGVVLIESPDEDVLFRFPKPYWDAQAEHQRNLRLAALAAPFGLTRLLGAPVRTDGLPDSVAGEAAALGYRASAYATAADESDALRAGADSLRTSRQRFTRLPWIVVSSRNPWSFLPDGLPIAEMTSQWADAQAHLLGRSGGSQQLISETGDHRLWLTDPGICSQAIELVLDTVAAG